MTYEEIIKALETAREGDVRNGLVLQVQQETLRASSAGYRKSSAMAQLHELYAHEISALLAMPPVPMAPRRVFQRRYATVWAVAEVLREHGLGPKGGA
jgi:hypothetical protein